jgi:hypothetical protein
MERFEVSVLVRGRQTDFSAITDFATGHGLEVIQRGGARLTVALSGTVAQFNDAFGVKLESGPPQLIEMTAGLLVASWDAVATGRKRVAIPKTPRPTLWAPQVSNVERVAGAGIDHCIFRPSPFTAENS